MLALAASVPVSAFAHITGGGLTDNIPRVLPAGLEVMLERASWPRDPLFEWLQRTAGIDDTQMHRTFNCGIGMVAIVPAAVADAARATLAAAGQDALVIGEVRGGDRGTLIR
jgi:phosphoribosylformylglycinamidine cyclo-ligase